MTATWTPPTTAIALPDLLNDLLYLKAGLDALSGGTVDLTAFVPAYSLSTDGKSLVVTSGPSSVSVPFPAGYSFKGAYTVGVAYAPKDLFTYLGTCYYVAAAFTATGPADIAANTTVFCSGGISNKGDWNSATTYSPGDAVTYPAGSVYVWWMIHAAAAGTHPPDLTLATPGTSAYWSVLGAGSTPFPATACIDHAQGETQDVINAALLTGLANLTTTVNNLVTAATAAFKQVTANTANIVLINNALGSAKVTLVQPAP